MDLVIGQTYNQRFIAYNRKRAYAPVRLVRINYELMRKDQIASVTVEVIASPGFMRTVNHLTLEPMGLGK